MTSEIELEVDRNFEYFQTIVGSLLPANEGRFALLRHAGMDGLFDTVVDAARSGASRFLDGVFSVQEVTLQPVDLGFYSHVAGNR